MKVIKVLSDFIDKKFYKTKLVNSQVLEKYNATNYGFQSRPIKGSNGVCIDEYVLGFVQKIVDGLEVGESIMFAKNETGEIVTKVLCKADGKLILNGEGDFAVRFNELKAEFNKLKDWAEGHKHPLTGLTAGPYPLTGTMLSPTDSSGANIDNCKVENVILPQKEN